MRLYSPDDSGGFLSISNDDFEIRNKGLKIPTDRIPVLPLRNTVMYPNLIIPITVNREKTIKAINKAMKGDKLIVVFSQKENDVDDPTQNDLFNIGTVAKIIKTFKISENQVSVILEGVKRAKLISITQSEPIIESKIKLLVDKMPKSEVMNATIDNIRDVAKNIIQLSSHIPNEAESFLSNIEGHTQLLHFIASNMPLSFIERQSVLEIDDMQARAEYILELLHREAKFAELKNQIQNKTRTDIDKQQKEYFLNQQLKNIHEELGADNPDKDAQRLIEKSKTIKLSVGAKEMLDKDIQKLKRTNASSPEYNVIFNHIETLLDLPWEIYTTDDLNLSHAQKILNQDHYNMSKIKERILEYLAVLKMKGNLKSPILCLVGPPGIGKTSLGKSIARAIGRKYIRMSLGGVHDESELRGHRKTYIGAMPGRIIQHIKKAKSSNPVFILDEIDKLGSDHRGDPSAALLEILDPEQNHTFYDNYLETEFDLSKVMFIATANYIQNIKPALRDRMEIIYLDGYSVEEKVQIGRKYLLPKQIKEHGLKAKDITMTDIVLAQMIEQYTRESGVRELDRRMAAVMRYRARQIATDIDNPKAKSSSPIIKAEMLETIFGATIYDKTMYIDEHKAGIAVGLAYTPMGGDILFIETTKSKGKGSLILTGSLGDVMKESASTALSYTRANADTFNIKIATLDESNIHIHVPEGATPKDGPSAGITLLCALVSLFKDKPLKSHLAMTGEITLRGKVLPVGGIKEKLLAAKRAGIKEIIISTQNKKNVEEIDKSFLKGVKFHYVDTMDEVVKKALK